MMNRLTTSGFVFLFPALISAILLMPATANDAKAPSAEPDPLATEWRDRYLALGKDIYQWACAECHDTGAKGAPQKGNRSDWSERSMLWSSVLIEHARQGYMEMPAKGGHPYLSDHAVAAAGEYMLGETFPELPRD